jgi:hypothetical protein
MSGGAMDGSASPGYLRGVGSRRPSLAVVLVTLVSGCILAAGGYALGHRSGAAAVPATVPVRAVPAPAGADPIVVPSAVELPSR